MRLVLALAVSRRLQLYHGPLLGSFMLDTRSQLSFLFPTAQPLQCPSRVVDDYVSSSRLYFMNIFQSDNLQIAQKLSSTCTALVRALYVPILF